MQWKRAAELIAAQVPEGSLPPAVLAWLEASSVAPASTLARTRGPWSVGFSGGADSLLLLLWLWARFPERRRGLRVLHFNHRLRGRESAGDARFCAGVCRSLGVRLVSGSWSRPTKAGGEASARKARIEFFDTAMRAARSRVLWTGHQADDVAETFLMRLARGSGTGGLCAPRPVHEQLGRVHVRPLLGLGKERIRALLSEAGIPWREDSSNAGDLYLRNRLRSEVLPAWREACGTRDALAGACLSRQLLEEDDEALTHWLGDLAPLKADGALDLEILAGKPRALWRRALHQWLLATPYRGDLSRQGFEALLVAAVEGRRLRLSLGAEGFAMIGRGCLRYERARPRRG